jgi:hypothetical protein
VEAADEDELVLEVVQPQGDLSRPGRMGPDRPTFGPKGSRPSALTILLALILV